MKEEPFTGGNLSGAVRVGDTVRRKAGPWTSSVHALLRHLRASGFDAAPLPLGLDEQGRETLEYIDGYAHPGWPEPMPEWMWNERCLSGAARLLRRYHDAVATFVPPADARWRMVTPTAHTLISHNDWAPYNAVFRARRPTVMIDWDLAAPANREWDLVASAYHWVPLYASWEMTSLTERAARFGRFCDAYGSREHTGLIALLGRQLAFVGDFIEEQAASGDAGFAKLAGWGLRAGLLRDAEFLEDNRDLFERARR